MEWTMFFLFVALKVPLLTLCWLVWWAIRQTDEPAQEPGEGGAKVRAHPLGPLPRPPRRGPHGDPAPLPPPRVRIVTARAREGTERTSSAGTGKQ
jgi:hypothetical protein